MVDLGIPLLFSDDDFVVLVDLRAVVAALFAERRLVLLGSAETEACAWPLLLESATHMLRIPL